MVDIHTVEPLVLVPSFGGTENSIEKHTLQIDLEVTI
jgi:hypothetical protein